MYLPVHVTGVVLSALVAAWASRSYVSAKLVAMARLHVDRDMPMAMQLPTSRSETMNHVLHCKPLIENVVYV